MNGIEKITQRINADAQAEIDRVLADAKAQAAEIAGKYKAQADAEAAALQARNEKAAAEREEREYGFEVTAGVSLCLIGLEICTLAAAAYADGTLITLSNATVITNALLAAITNGFLYNALHFVVKFIVPFTGRRRMHEKTVQSEFFRCKKYLNRAESLFMFMLLLNRILARRNTPIDATLLAVHLAAFLCTGIYAIASGAVLFFRAGRRRRAETE